MPAGIIEIESFGALLGAGAGCVGEFTSSKTIFDGPKKCVALLFT